MPYREIASRISRDSTPGKSLVLADSVNTDSLVFHYYLGPDWNVIFVDTPESLTRAIQLAADPRVERIWYLRNTHDVTSGPRERRSRTRANLHMDSPDSPILPAFLAAPTETDRKSVV